MGEKDLIKPYLGQREGSKVVFGRLLMKPGKPTTFAVINDKTLFFALPGNPVSCYVTSQLFVIPSAKRLY
jgi:gephyrin